MADNKLLAVKGMNDLLPPDSARWEWLEGKVRGNQVAADSLRVTRRPPVRIDPDDAIPYDDSTRGLHLVHPSAWRLYPRALTQAVAARDQMALGTFPLHQRRPDPNCSPATALHARRPEFEVQAILGLFPEDPVDFSYPFFGTFNVRITRVSLDELRDVLARGMRARGAAVDVVTAYRNLPPPDLPGRLGAALAGGVDIVTFASPSAVEALVAAAPDAPGRVPAAVIGPVTEAAARAAGFEVVAVAVPSTAAGLLSALRAWLAARGRPLTR